MAAEAPRPITTETKLSLPLNGSIFTTTSPCAAEKPALSIGASMGNELGAAWKDSLVIDCNHIPSDGNKREMRITHARIPLEVDQLASNWEFSTCSIGGRQFPSVQRTVILLSNASYRPSGSTFDIFAHAAPIIGSAMPVETGSAFSGAGYILADRQVVKSGMQIEPVFIVERRNYILKTTRTNIGVDPLNGLPLWSETTLYYTGETVPGSTAIDGGPTFTVDALFAAKIHRYWGIQTNGTRRTGQQLSCAWYAITTELVVAGAATDGVVAIDSYESDVDYSWPPVLNAFIVKEWVRRDGGVDKYPFYKMKPEAYYGPCNAVVTRTWKSTPFINLYSERMLPTPMHYGSPFYNLNLPECLHESIDVRCDIGSGDPYYAVNSGSLENFAATTMMTALGATSCITWPPTIRAYDEQVPFRGGYLRTVRIVDAPNT